MPPPLLTRSAARSLIGLGLLAVSACNAAPEPAQPARPISAEGLACDQDQTSLQAKDTIERVGGLVTDDYVVRFAESTRVGVVALVVGDTRTAFDELHRTYGVAVVAAIDDDGSARVTGFDQIRDIVAATCRS